MGPFRFRVDRLTSSASSASDISSDRNVELMQHLRSLHTGSTSSRYRHIAFPLDYQSRCLEKVVDDAGSFPLLEIRL